MRAIAVIPARGGSKGIPRKNIRFLHGIPMINYSILAAQKVPWIEKILVSTEDPEIAQIASSAGAEIIYRTPELAGDLTPTEPVVIHALDCHRSAYGHDPDWVVLLQPTSPLRDSSDIESACKILIDSQADSVLTVCEKREFHWRETAGGAEPLWDIKHRPRRQDMEPDYVENGAIYITRTSVYRTTSNRLGGKIALSVMPQERSLDIDEPYDLWLAEQWLKYMGGLS